ncbi:hypothetical protein BDV12DRAFT_197743 [Aspergillus spectabilis]
MADCDETRLARQRTSLVSLKVPSPFEGLPTFSKTPTDLEISLIDINTYTTTPAEPLVIKNEEQFKQHITTRAEPQIRIISICSKNSVRPLLISQSAMQTLLDRYDIGVEFLDLVHSFGRKPQISDAGHGRMTMHRRPNGAYDIQYLLPYVESYITGGSMKYTDRWLEVAVDLGNRNSTGQINKRMLQLTSHSVDDSAAVRVITFLTMLYLPPSFVSTFLGMDLFKFDNANGSAGLTISKGFWLFFVLCIPLSAGTFFSWKVFWNKHRQRRQQSDLGQVNGIELAPMY